MENLFPKELFGLSIRIDGPSRVVDRVPLSLRDKYDLLDARLGSDERGSFILARVKGWPSVIASRSLQHIIGEADSRPVGIGLECVDIGLKNALIDERIPFISHDGNVFLPFVGLIAVPPKPLAAPEVLSPQAQRILINLLTGRWNGLNAGELAKNCNRSRASVTGYLAEIKAIAPSLVRTDSKRRVLENPGIPTGELLERFEPYLSSPVTRTHRLANNPGLGLLANFDAIVAGESALAFYTDLAHDGSHLTVVMNGNRMNELKEELRDGWKTAEWHEDAPLTIEEWSYPCDGATDISLSATGMRCADPCSLYLCLRPTIAENDVRMTDALEQLKELVWQQ